MTWCCTLTSCLSYSRPGDFPHSCPLLLLPSLVPIKQEAKEQEEQEKQKVPSQQDNRLRRSRRVDLAIQSQSPRREVPQEKRRSMRLKKKQEVPAKEHQELKLQSCRVDLVKLPQIPSRDVQSTLLTVRKRKNVSLKQEEGEVRSKKKGRISPV